MLEDAGPTVEFAVRSTVETPVAIRARDMPPVGCSPTDLHLEGGGGAHQWRSDGEHLALSAVVDPGGSLIVRYSIPGADELRFDGDPVIDGVQPVASDATGANRSRNGSTNGDADGTTVPMWRSAASTPLENGAGTVSAGASQAAVGGPTLAEASVEFVDVEASEESPLLQADSDVTPTLSVVMPTLNEEAGVATCIDAVITAVENLGINAEVIVSDSSIDRTPEIAREKGAIVVEPDGAGYGYAYRYAFERARGEFIAIGDADTTYDFEALPELLEPVRNGEADMVMGSRLAGDIRPGAMPPLHEHIGNPLLTRFLNTFYDAGVTDAHSGFRVIRRDALESLPLTSDGMEFASEMIMAAGAADLRIEEVPITYHEREGEATLDSFQDGWRHVKFMLVNAPGYVYSVPGALLCVLGVVVMGLVLTRGSVAGVPLGIHSLVGGSLATIVGHQLMSLGVFATAAGSPITRPNDPVTTWISDVLTMERGAVLGGTLTLLGGAYAIYVIGQWIASGFTDLPLLFGDVVALTVIVLGIQTVFYSLFMTTIDPQW